MSLRIAVFHCGFTYSGGGERQVLEEVRGLRELGHVVECYAPTIDRRNCFPELIAAVGPRPLVPQLPRWFPLRDAIHMLLASALAPILALTMPSFDVLVGANQPGAWVAWVLSRLRRLPYVAYINQPCRLVYPRAVDLETGWQTKRDYQLLNALIQRTRGFVRWADWVSVRGAGRLLVNGGFVGAQVARLYERDVVDCPGGCHPPDAYERGDFSSGDLTVNGRSIPKPYVLLTNRHYPQKRFDFAIRALDILRRQRAVDVPLVITGSATGYTRQLQTLAAQLDMSERVRFVGEVDERTLEDLYRNAAVYVYSSPEEDFGLGVLEAMAHGLPVVAWAHGGPTVTVRDAETGLLALPYDIEDFAAKIAQVLGDAACNRRLGESAMRHVRDRFSWTHHVRTLEGALTEARGVRVAPPTQLPRERRRTPRRRYTAVWEKRRLIASLSDARLALDVGAGGGEYVPDLLLRAKRVVAVDNDPARVLGLLHRFGHVGNVWVVQASIDSLPFRSGAFDLVWASEVLEHLPSLDVLGELERTSSREIVATMPSPFGPYRYLDATHVLPYSIGSLRRAIGGRVGWSYSLEGLGLCLPQWMGLDAFRERWLALSRGRPWAAWTLLIRGRRRTSGALGVAAEERGAAEE
ncbi:MAG TPA: glycosyltransferase [Candidatus Limnocylindria bacterium]|jgi:glycosyltransferase involved in cell wall biosynthesis|nr:glycosyltransferase [Candidatus Limnocylindria bacterium]